MESGAVLSACDTWRYKLWRIWDDNLPICTFVLLNPSTADAEHDDPTLRKCMAISRHWGYGGLRILNLYALRATDPRELRTAPDPIGPENDRFLCEAVVDTDEVICGWGNHGQLHQRNQQVLELLKVAGVAPLCLMVNKSGAPKHPLYCPADTEPTGL